MSVGEPFINVECEKCGYVSDPMTLTPLAGGGWDARNIKPTLKRWGWTVDGDSTICDYCTQKTTEDHENSGKD